MHPESGIRIMPIKPSNLRVGVATDASRANARDKGDLENNKDNWEEKGYFWIRHHVASRRVPFHPGAAAGGPDLHDLLPIRKTIKTDGLVSEDSWKKGESFKAVERKDRLREATWWREALSHRDQRCLFETDELQFPRRIHSDVLWPRLGAREHPTNGVSGILEV